MVFLGLNAVFRILTRPRPQSVLTSAAKRPSTVTSSSAKFFTRHLLVKQGAAFMCPLSASHFRSSLTHCDLSSGVRHGCVSRKDRHHYGCKLRHRGSSSPDVRQRGRNARLGRKAKECAGIPRHALEHSVARQLASQAMFATKHMRQVWWLLRLSVSAGSMSLSTTPGRSVPWARRPGSP